MNHRAVCDEMKFGRKTPTLKRFFSLLGIARGFDWGINCGSLSFTSGPLSPSLSFFFSVRIFYSQVYYSASDYLGVVT